MKLAGTCQRNTFSRCLVIVLTAASICNHAFSEEALKQPTSTFKVAEANQAAGQPIMAESEGAKSNTFNVEILLGKKTPANDKPPKSNCLLF